MIRLSFLCFGQNKMLNRDDVSESGSESGGRGTRGGAQLQSFPTHQQLSLPPYPVHQPMEH